MKIERLNENSIRCTLNRADLDSRELKISELAYGTEKAKSLFKDMIAQASYECGFEAEDIPLMIEAIPVSPDCIVLVITKVEDPEELDTRFSKFAPSSEEDDYADMIDEEDDEDTTVTSSNPSSLLNKINEALGGSEDAFVPFFDSLKSKIEEAKNAALEKQATAAEATPEEPEGPIHLEKMFSFASFNEACVAALAIKHRFTGDSSLYKNPASNRYYLLIESEEMKPDEFAGICNTLTEYGLREKLSYATMSYLEEHDEVIIANEAVKTLASFA